ncbi:MAG: ABC transporter ATP-binding protein [Coriobacteriia bacterium]|nr:ABC transporter ATP-binding protein [Coriobacteriia bacterium]MCL2536777.1 ABC transporter ATP-binding protein [Coriobacteriia bacterium]
MMKNHDKQKDLARQSKTAVKISNVNKEYILYKSDRERFAALFHKSKKLKRHDALKDINFEVGRGEAVGIIGRNGAGKSTLLKIVTGVTFPTSGEVEVNGNVAALLELTAGFSNEMTGRENIYLKGFIMGYSKDEIEQMETLIIEFAELGEYIDQPLFTYSSGMKMRLGFAISANSDPDILVVDEALSVGDAKFREKCNKKINELAQSGVTLLYVSHSMTSVEELCSRVLYIKKGELIYDGDVETAIETYEKHN